MKNIALSTLTILLFTACKPGSAYKVVEQQTDNGETKYVVVKSSSADSKVTKSISNKAIEKREGLYLGAGLDRSYYDDFEGSDLDINSGSGRNFSVGTYLGNHLRGELEVSNYEHNAEEAGKDFDTLAVMANGYIDLSKPNSKIGGYIGGGLGIADIKEDGASKDTYTAAQGKVGLSYKFTPKTALDLGYKYFYAGKYKFEASLPSTKDEYETHNFGVGFRLGF